MGDEVPGQFGVGGALGDHPALDLVDLAVPQDRQRQLVDLRGLEDAAVVGMGHRHLAIGEKLHGLGVRTVAEVAELAERISDALS